MSLTDDFLKGLDKRGVSINASSKNNSNTTKKKKKKEETVSSADNFTNDFLNGLQKRNVQVGTDDFAPIKTVTTTKKKKDDEKRTWFNSGEFADGYDFGDITKTILGSSTDLVEDIGTGIIGMGEKAWDGLLMLGSAMNGQQMNQAAQNEMIFNAVTGKETKGVLENYQKAQKQVEKETAEYVKKDLYDEADIAKQIITRPVEKFASINVEDTSVFGAKSDSLIQSGGQLLGTAGLQAVGLPWFVTTGATAYGSQAEQALNEGATFNEANASALISAGAEILTEKLSGGIKFGGKTLDDVLLKPLTEKITSKTLKTLTNLGLDAVGEGSEEVVSSIMSNLGTALYKEDKVSDILFSEEAVDEYIESFIGGSVLGGVSSGIGAIRNGVEETYTENEQKVIDKEIENRIAEIEQDGNKLTKKEKADIKKQVLNDLDKGAISIDTIESVLGGETYNNYKSTVEREDSLIKEFEELGNKTNATLKEQTRYKELADLVEEYKSNSQRSQLKTQLSDEVFNLAKDSRLAESYNEQTRKSQYYETDLTKYDEKQRAIVQKAIDSKVLNNTNRTHDFVDMVSKLSAEKGVLFDFTNNEKLKESGFAVEGKTVNGFVNENGDIVLNMDSHKAHRSVVGHEITHILEGTELYTELQEMVKQYATTKGEYAERMQSLRDLYTGVYEGKDFDEKIQRELTADIVGDYLFTDEKFINSLSTEKPNLFKRIYNEIKYLYKVATAGSKEARELEKVKRAFDKAYKQSGKKNTDTKYSVSNKNAWNNIKNIQGLEGYSVDEVVNMTKDHINNILSENGEQVKIVAISPYGSRAKGTANNKSDLDIVVQYEGDIREDDMFNMLNDEEVKLYFDDIEVDINPIKAEDSGSIEEYLSRVYDYDKHNAKYSLSDSDGKQLTKEQQDYFKDSKVRDENGNLKVMYHGSQDAGFHTFDSSMSDDDTSFFFVDRNDVAATYSGTSETYEAKTIRTTEDMNNFLAEIGYDDYKAVEKNGKFELLENNEHVAYSDTAQGLYEEFCWYEGVGDGDANYKVYLNLTNPLEVDAEGRNWNNVSREFSQEVADRYNSLIAEEKAALVNLAEWGEYSIFRDEMLEARANEQGGGVFDEEYTKHLARAYEKLGGANANLYDAFSIASDNFSAESIQKFAVKQMNTRDYAKKAKDQGYDGVIFKNIHDNGGYSNGSEGASTVAIAFESNQIKSVANTKPTKKADIRYSLSDSEGNSLTEEQQKFFKNSQIRDDNGSLKVMYHGSQETFTVFDKKKARSGGTYGKGFYFTDSTSHAGTYGDTYDVYLNITNPLQNGTNNITKDQLRKFVEALAEDEDYGLENYGYGATIDSVTDSIYGKSDFGMLLDLNVSCVGDMVEAVELFNKVNGTNYDGIVAPTETVAFYPNQIKKVDNKAPTSNSDIRFSLSESVEETKDLVAVHNLSEEKLLKSLKLGGLPMPSIAIARAKEGHSNFGTISLVFSKDTISPTDRRNKVYSGDAWTPTYPRVEYEVSDKEQAKIEKRINSIVPEEVLRDLGGLRIDSDNLQDDLNRFNGNMVDAFRNNTALKYAFLVESGSKLELPTKNKPLGKYSNHPDEAIIRVAETVSEEKLRGIRQEYTTEQVYEIEPEIRKAVNEYLQEKYKALPEKAKEKLIRTDTMSMGDIDYYAEEALNYLKNGLEQEIDYYSSRDLINDAVDTQKYEAWVNDLFANIIQSEGIRNNKDLFTPSGNRRSFKALHYEHNLENVIKAMKEQGTKGVGAFGGGNIFGASTTEYGSIAEIKEDANNRMKNLPESEYEEIRNGFRDRFFELANSLPIHNDSFTAVDSASEMLVEAVVKFKTKSGMANYLRNESKGWANYSDHIVDDLVELVNDIRNMPVGYFEAKPQRAVGINEVATAIIPDNASAELKNILTENGVKYIEYEKGNEQARVEALNSLDELKFSLSKENDIAPIKSGNVPLKDLAYQPTVSKMEQVQKDILPIKEGVAKNATTIPEEFAPMTEAEFNELNDDSGRLNSLTDNDMPPIKEAPYYERDTITLPQKRIDGIAKTVYDYVFPKHGEKKVLKDVIQRYATSEIPDRYALFDEIKKVYGERTYTEEDVDLLEVQNVLRAYPLQITDDIKAEYPEYADFMRTHKGRLLFSNRGAKVDDAYQELSNLYPGYFPDTIWNSADQFARMVEVSEMDRFATDTWELLDEDIQRATDIIADEVAKYTETQLQKLSEQTNRAFYKMSPKYWEALMPPIAEGVSENTTPTKDIAPEKTVKTEKQNKGNMQDEKIAQILMNEPKVDKKKGFKRDVERFMSNFVDRAAPIETLALKTGNRELDGKFNTIRYADTKAQTLIGEGANGVKSINDIFGQVGSEADLEKFYNYLYHKHNVDRMSLESREAENLARLTEEMHQLKLDNLEEKQLYAIAKESTDDTTEKRAHIIETVREYLKASEVKNKPVYGDSVTAQISQEIVEKYEFNNPDFIKFAEDVYNYNRHLRNELVEGGVISQETADLFEELYPHYVPIRRVNHNGNAVNVPLDTRKTGVNAPIKRAQGGNSDILPLAQTMAQRTLQTYKAVAKNRFGVELKNTLGTTIESTETDVDEIVESVDTHEELLKEGKHGANPTFTVFENGEKVTFEITEAIYDALKPTSEALSKTYNVLSKPTGLFKKLVTEYNPAFMLTNPIKDTQDVLINSQHPLKTYKNYPKAIAGLLSKKGRWYNEYMSNGGKDDSYFDRETNTFTEEKSGVKKVVGFPFEKISEANNFLERLPRLAEYIASREMGRSIDVAMLDSARVTTNFRAGGDVTKFLNRNGVTFLNPSVQGAVQQVRNVREAKANGLKGWALLATKVALAGLPGMLLNGLLWDDDEDYEELSDYVKQNYYIVWKNEDGKFIRIPKGRALAVIQNAFTQVQNAVTGNDEVDISSFLELVANNLAPNNPLENNILAPIMQVKNNKTWYGEDLVSSRLADLPTKEQFDESTDKISRWLGDKLNVSPVKVNYLLNQYSGGVGDMLLPMLTPEAESGKNSLLSNFTAPIRDKFTTDSVMNNQNVSNFYEVSDELKVNANSSEATEEDILKNKYFNAIRTEMSELYKEKREIQNNEYLNDSEKYNRVREVQEEINALSEEALNSYNSVAVDGKYAEIGDKQYKLNSDNEWQKISDEEIEKQNEVIGILGITKSQYWNNKKEYDMKAFYPEKYKVLQEQGISVEDYKENYEEMAHIYTDDYSWASDNPEKYTLSKAVTDDVSVYKQYTSDLYNIKADKDSNGKSISGSRKEKVHDYIFDLDIEDGAKYILFKSEYNADDTYNYEIINYLNEREDISYTDMETILKELGFEVDSQGNISW